MANLAISLEMIKMNIEAAKDGYGVAKTIALSGKPGIGKTERTRQLAEELQMEFYHQSMPEMDISVMSGLPEFYDVDEINVEEYHKNNIKGQGVVWSMPEVIMNANILAQKNKNGVILMLDDLHQTPISTMPYLYQLLNEKSLGNYKLDDNVFLVAGLNDSEDANFDGIESPVMNRMNFMKTEFDVVEFLDGYAKKFPFQIRSFLEQNPDFVNEEESTISAFGTPRSWNALSESFAYVYNKNKDFLLNNVFTMSSGHISDKASLEFEKHIAYIEKLNLKKYVTARKMFDVSEKKALDQVLMGYLPNFIKNIEDGEYLCQLMEKNIENSNFIAFSMAEIYAKYSNAINKNDEELKTLTDGIKLVIAKILDDEDIIKRLKIGKNKSDCKIIDKLELKLESKEVFFDLLSNFVE